MREPPLRAHDYEDQHVAILRQVLDELRAVQASLRARIEPRLLTVEQAGIYIGRTRKGMECLMRTNKIATIRSDSRVFFDRRDLDAWIERNRF